MVFREQGTYSFSRPYPDNQELQQSRGTALPGITGRNGSYNARCSAFTISTENIIPSTEEKKEDDVEGEESQLYIKMSRKVIIEPALIMALMFYVSWYALVAQYHYYAIGERYNLTAIMEAEGDMRNQTQPGEDDGGRCGSVSGNTNSTAYHLQQRTQGEAARFQLYMDIVTNVPGFVVLLFFGRLMDQVGRRPVLIISVCGTILRVFLYILQQLIGFPLELLLITGFIEAVTGGMWAFITACYAYLADTIPPNDRAKRMTIAQMASTISMALTNFGMSFLIENLGFLWPTVIVCGGHTLNLIYVVFFVPETRTEPAKWNTVSPKYIVDSFTVIIRKRVQNGRKLLLIFVLAWLTWAFSLSGASMYSLYKLNSPFCWTPTMLGTFDAVNMLLCSGAQFFAAMFLYKRFDHGWLCIISLCSYIGFDVTTAVAQKDWNLWIAPVVGVFMTVATPLLRAIMSKLVLPSEQGSLFSCLMALEKGLMVVGSAMYSNIYAATLYFFKGTVFFVMSFFMCIAIAIIGVFIAVQRKEELRKQLSKEMCVDENIMDEKNEKD